MSKPGKDVRRPVVRCAIYTRKSTEEGLEQEFNSLDAQRESAEAFIASQKPEGWVCLPDQYNDGGFTGGNMERPAVKRLMEDIEAGKIDCVVVYKVDRLSRSLMDFARLMELFERKKIAFVSVTQQFNTSHSMGRLTLNILLSFAQFEREIISERTRDKISAARRKGKWSGGRTIMGYDVDPLTKKLVVNEPEAKVVREIFNAYLDRKSLLTVCKELNARGITTKAVVARRGKGYGGRCWDKAAVLKLLTNVLCIGKVRYKTEVYEGEHAAIVDMELWNNVQDLLRANGRSGGMHARNKYGALLKGMVHCKPCGLTMGHTYAVSGGKRVYRYYVCYKAQKQGWEACPCRSLPAEQIEQFVVEQIKRISQDPDLLSATLAELRDRSSTESDVARADLVIVEREIAQLRRDLIATAKDAATSPAAAGRLADLHSRIAECEGRQRGLLEAVEMARASEVRPEEVRQALAEFDGTWARLSPKEQSRMLRALIQRVDYDGPKGSVAITFHPLGLRSLEQVKEAV